MITDNHVLYFIRERMSLKVKGGFESKEDILKDGYERAIAEFGDNFDSETLKKLVESAVETLFQEHHDQQAQWQSPTDCDRLDKVFESLEAKGLFARQNYWCCPTDAVIAVTEDIEAFPEKHGYVFYDEQDTESAILFGSVCLFYGSIEEFNTSGYSIDDKIAEIGEQIAQTLREAGFQFEWSDPQDKVIKVVGLDWKRRR